MKSMNNKILGENLPTGIHLILSNFHEMQSQSLIGYLWRII